MYNIKGRRRGKYKRDAAHLRGASYECGAGINMRKNKILRIIAAALLSVTAVFALLPTAAAAVNETNAVCIGGFPFGVRVMTDGVSVAEIEEVTLGDGSGACPAKDAGLNVHDVITGVNGTRITTSEELLRIIAESSGDIEIKYRRGGTERTATVTPVTDADGNRRVGIWVRDSTAGIGTVTFYNPETGGFAGLGHGICDAGTGELTPVVSGIVTDVTISGVNRGTAGVPGEIRGYFGTETLGKLLKNSVTGIYGVLTTLPDGGEIYEIAPRADVCEGEVTIRTTLENGQTRDYSAEITDVDYSSVFGKSFVVVITDPELIGISGGIVQGMSGSPIIQNGKLVGAVTHVMVSDPTRGYGIFAETMYDELCGIDKSE
ncbi:MAG: PDZ domain-containing protein [Firmicutes bacterium]|nr:PDZ domain-containing protein [Bacillota bacterium]